MKYWQEERWQTVNKTNVPHLYLYTWIRFCLWLLIIINSIIILAITGKGLEFVDEMDYRPACIILVIMAILTMLTLDSSRKVDRTMRHVVIDLFVVSLISIFYASYYFFMIFLYILEIGIVLYLGIKIDQDNRLVDNNKIVLWWKQKERERSERQLQRFLAKHKVEQVKDQLTEEQRLKKMSRKQRKEYKQKKNK